MHGLTNPTLQKKYGCLTTHIGGEIDQSL